MDIKNLRENIDTIDKKLTELFSKRMDVAAKIAEYKREKGLPVLDPVRERVKLSEISDMTPEELRDYSEILYSIIFELSRDYQSRILGNGSDLTAKIENAIENTPRLFPEQAFVACQGVAGSNSQYACDRLFRRASIMYFSSFDAVFKAIEKGLCKYGVIPVENSTAGSVNSVYDLMMSHRFSIVRSIRIKIEHCLLANPGTKIEDVKEIYSHEQAISQCSNFLGELKGVKVIPCENTAVAAKMVAESGRKDIAALASKQCISFYGLSCLKDSVQNTENNYTRFICISKELEIYPGADRTSVMLTLPHVPGSLYKLLARFYALGVNINKLESRPLPGKEFEFMFYFDFDTPVYSPRLLRLLGDLPGLCEQFSYLGSYSEVL